MEPTTQQVRWAQQNGISASEETVSSFTRNTLYVFALLAASSDSSANYEALHANPAHRYSEPQSFCYVFVNATNLTSRLRKSAVSGSSLSTHSEIHAHWRL
jgi:hypothetical protein